MKWNIFVGSLVLGLGLSTQSFGMDLLDRMLGMDYNGGAGSASCCETNCVDPGPSCGCETSCDTSCVPCKAKCRKTPLLDMLKNLRCKAKKSCCDGGCADPGCGCEVADPGCGCEPECGCEVVDPGCGCETACDSVCGAKKRCRRPLLDMLNKLRSKSKKSCCDTGCADPGCGCEVADPGCGCEPECGCEVVDPGCGCETACGGCDSACGSKKRCGGSLLDRIFSRKCKKSSCCDSGCADPGCGCEVVDPGCGCEPACGCESGYDTMTVPADEPTEADKDEVGPAPVVDPSAFLPTKRRFIQTNLVR